ncbi:MAG: hypothetical protein D6769_01285 [Methanobacteriota archaeon]|nr:MAG: hypothetical protein D6769_01285 [Euryarchaeota archaeon]
MNFKDWLSSVFGDVKPFSGYIDETALSVSLPRNISSRASVIRSAALSGDPVGMVACSPLITYMAENSPSCNVETYDVLVWTKQDKKDGDNSLLSAYGPSKENSLITVKATPRALYAERNGEPLSSADLSQFESIRPSSGTIVLKIAEDLLSKKLFGKSLNFNIAKARYVSMEVDGKLYSWKRYKAKLSRNPLIALAQAIDKFKDKGEVGAVSSGTYYVNPEFAINFSSISNYASSLDGVSRARLLHIYNLFKQLRNAYAFYMNVGGRVRELYDRESSSLRLFNKEVFISSNLLSKSWKEGVDYRVVAKGIYGVILATLMETMEGTPLFLTPVPIRGSSSYVWRARLKRASIADIRVKATRTKDSIIVKYERANKDYEFFPLSFKEEYSLSLFGDSVVGMVEK